MKSINILAVDNGVGISRDVAILKKILSPHYDVETNHTYKIKPTRRYDLNIHLERFNPYTFELADINVMIPNQEWFEKSWLPAIDSFDYFFTKTIFADNIFKSIGCKTNYIGFTSEDRLIGSDSTIDPANLYMNKDPFHWLHVAGKSIQKQTDIVIRTWQNNPGFPQLTIIQDPKFWKPRTLCRNINYMIDRVPEPILKALQNSNLVHVCPSETEGFGHYIMEAMSARSIVIATDGPPMNELVTEERGFLVKPVRQDPMNLSTKFIIDERGLEEVVVKAMVMDDGRKSDMMKKAREFYECNNETFIKRLTTAVKCVFDER